MYGLLNLPIEYLSRMLPQRRTGLDCALAQLVPAKEAGQLRRVCESPYLLDSLVERHGLNRKCALETAAEALGFCSILHPEVPSAALVERTGHSAQTLRKHFALPQPSLVADAGYALLVADPELLNVEEFRCEGVQVLLGYGRAISAAWTGFARQSKFALAAEMTDAGLIALLSRVANDAEALGAAEVFIGHPEDGCYEFVAGDRKFSGRIHPHVYQKLLDAFHSSTALTFEGPETSQYHVALTRSFERAVVCLCWTKPSKSFPSPAPICAQQPTHVLKEAPQHGPRPAVTGSRILLVEDDSRFAAILRAVLEQKNFLVEHVPNGRAAVQQLERQTYDLVICDVHMPVLDGPSFVTEIRTGGSRIPICMLTSDEDQLLEAELALSGANAYVRKQEDPRVLIAWIHNLLALSAREKKQ